MRKISKILLLSIIISGFLYLESCEKKKATPMVQLIKEEVPGGDSNIVPNGFPIITLTAKNVSGLNAYNVACSFTAFKHDSVVYSDTAIFTQTYMTPNQIDTVQAWFFKLKSFKQFDHISYVLYWWDVNSVFYIKNYP